MGHVPKDFTNIMVSKDFVTAIRAQGKYGESYEDIIRRLLKWDPLKKQRIGRPVSTMNESEA